MTKILLEVPKEVSQVTKKLKDAGFESYLVGGCVRDLLLHVEPTDWDITTNATPEEIQGLFEHTFYENDFGTVGVVNDEISETLKDAKARLAEFPVTHDDVSQETINLAKLVKRLESIAFVEVTPYRVDSEYSNNRHPDSISFSQTLAEDLMRRDFTINAIAYDCETSEIIDYHNGIQDLNSKIINTVGEPNKRFGEDALRIMRAIRFTAQLGFTINKEVQDSILSNHSLLKNISRERIRDEFVKILMTKDPLHGVYMAKDLHVLDYISPHLSRGIDVKQNGAHKYDVFEHLVRTMQHGADREWSLIIRLSGLLHDISKPETRRWSEEKGDYTFYGHEVVGARVTREILTDLKFSSNIVERVTTLVRWHMFFSDPDQISLSAVRRIVRNVGEENVWDLIRLRICDRIGMGRPKEKSYRLRKYVAMMEEAMRSPVSVKDLKINGDQIMNHFKLKPGRKIGLVLNALMGTTLDNPEHNNFEYLLGKAEEYLTLEEEELIKFADKGRVAITEAEQQELSDIKKKHKVQ